MPLTASYPAPPSEMPPPVRIHFPVGCDDAEVELMYTDLSRGGLRGLPCTANTVSMLRIHSSRPPLRRTRVIVSRTNRQMSHGRRKINHERRTEFGLLLFAAGYDTVG